MTLSVSRKTEGKEQLVVIENGAYMGMYGTVPVTETLHPSQAERFARDILKKVEECRAIDRQKIKPFWK